MFFFIYLERKFLKLRQHCVGHNSAMTDTTPTLQHSIYSGLFPLHDYYGAIEILFSLTIWSSTNHALCSNNQKARFCCCLLRTF